MHAPRQRAAACLLELFALSLVVTVTVAAAAPASRPGSQDAVKFELFVMSRCPYAAPAIEALRQAKTRLGPAVDIQVDYIGEAVGSGFTSLHGPDEVAGDKLQLCVNAIAPDRWWDFVECQNKAGIDLEKSFGDCARASQIKVEPIAACFEGHQGNRLLAASFKRSRDQGALGSPTLIVAGTTYTGRRSAMDLVRAICARHPHAVDVAGCQNLPELPRVDILVLDDRRCADCNTQRLIAMVKSRVADPVVKQLDYSDAEGKKLYDQLQGANLPALLFDRTLARDADAAALFAHGLVDVGPYQSLQVGASWNPICANENGCRRPECAEAPLCRQEIPGKLEVFVMSQCPYGLKAFDALKEFLPAMQGTVGFTIHYVAMGTARHGFKSLHGAPEIDEDMRQLCAARYYAQNNRYLDYIWCRNQDIRNPEWQACATPGIDAKVIDRCVKSEGPGLLEADIKITDGLGIAASPTWVANNKHKFHAIDAATIKANFCSHNQALKQCAQYDKSLLSPEGE